MSDEGIRTSRRAVLAGAAGVGSTGLAAALSGSEDDVLMGGSMSLGEAHNVAGDLWIGPKAGLSDVSPDTGRVYMATDSQIEYHGDGENWVAMGVGSEADPVPESHTESGHTESMILKDTLSGG